MEFRLQICHIKNQNVCFWPAPMNLSHTCGSNVFFYSHKPRAASRVLSSYWFAGKSMGFPMSHCDSVAIERKGIASFRVAMKMFLFFATSAVNDFGWENNKFSSTPYTCSFYIRKTMLLGSFRSQQSNKNSGHQKSTISAMAQLTPEQIGQILVSKAG